LTINIPCFILSNEYRGDAAIKVSRLILNQDKWINELSLKYHNNYTYSPMICLTLALSTLSKQVENGYFIAKQEFTINTQLSLEKTIELRGEISKKKHLSNMNYLICQSEVIENKNVLMEMSSTLIKMNQQPNKKADITQDKTESFINISKNQVHIFNKLSGDPNSIHKGKSPVVQAMFLLLLIEDHLATANRFIKKGEIIYLNPIVADCKLFFSWESADKLSGIVNNIKCFTLIIREEFLC
jgi:hypothetical protein